MMKFGRNFSPSHPRNIKYKYIPHHLQQKRELVFLLPVVIIPAIGVFFAYNVYQVYKNRRLREQQQQELEAGKTTDPVSNDGITENKEQHK